MTVCTKKVQIYRIEMLRFCNQTIRGFCDNILVGLYDLGMKNVKDKTIIKTFD